MDSCLGDRYFTDRNMFWTSTSTSNRSYDDDDDDDGDDKDDDDDDDEDDDDDGWMDVYRNDFTILLPVSLTTF